MTKNQVLDMHAHLLRANYQQFFAAHTFIESDADADNYLCHALFHAFDKLVLFYSDYPQLFNDVEGDIMSRALTIWENSGDELTPKEICDLADIQNELYEYYNDTLDEDGYYTD